MATRQSNQSGYDYNRNSQSRYGDTVRKTRDFLEDNGGFNLFAWAVFLALVAIAVKVMTINIAPYLILFGSPVPAPSNIPIIGWLWDLLVILFMGLGAAISWGIINASQILWILIMFDTKATRAAARASREAESAFDDSDRNVQLRRAKRRAMKIPFFFQISSGYLALAAFVAEFLISLRAYPPFKDFGEFMAGLAIGDFSIVDWENILSQFWCVFSTELVVIACIAAFQWAYFSKRG